MSNVTIREAAAPDFPRLMGFDHSSISEYVWQLDLRKDKGQVNVGFREVRLPREVNVNYPRDPFSLADDNTQRTLTLMAQIGEDPVGYLCIIEHSKETTAWITDLVVTPTRRRSGVGSSLLSAAQDWALSRSDSNIFLEMSSKNYPAIRFALKSGFEFCGYNDQYYVTQDVALFFGRSLL